METSAKTSLNVNEIFLAIGKYLYNLIYKLSRHFINRRYIFKAKKLPKSDVTGSSQRTGVELNAESLSTGSGCCK